jgi:hypothetical protein
MAPIKIQLVYLKSKSVIKLCDNLHSTDRQTDRQRLPAGSVYSIYISLFSCNSIQYFRTEIIENPSFRM